MTDLIALTRSYTDRIQNGRTLEDINDHLHSEVEELDAEFDGTGDGRDGVFGEAIDVVLCGLDLAFKARPDLTDEQIMAFVKTKLDKWERYYANSVHKVDPDAV